MTSVLRIQAESMRLPQRVDAQKTPWVRLRPDETQYRHPANERESLGHWVIFNINFSWKFTMKGRVLGKVYEALHDFIGWVTELMTVRQPVTFTSASMS